MSNRNHFTTKTCVSTLAFLMFSQAVYAAEEINPNELINLSLEQLSNIEVTSVSKKSEKASEAAAAISVISQDDIRRSGLTTIPELLRMVPGVNVAQSGAHDWSVSIRGFNDQFANKLLVLIDGRTVYTPLFSGVFWNLQDTPLQDIERIEVIRGPGATLWGANAVNGVINIITKNSKDTQGGFASQTVGTQINSQTTIRHGVKTDGGAYVRTYAKYDDNDSYKKLTGGDARDTAKKAQGGFRADWKSGESQAFTFQGDVYHAAENTVYNLPLPNQTFNTVLGDEKNYGGNVLGRWNNKISKDSDLTVQIYYDGAVRDLVPYYASIQTFDFDLQHLWTAIDSHEIIWGAGYRVIETSVNSTPYITFANSHRSDNLLSSFVQDKITLNPNDLFLTIGSKFEHNAFTGLEIEPSARLSWLIDGNQTLWGAVSRAVRTPSITLEDIQFISSTLGANLFAARVGSKSVKSEELLAYELGYRIQPMSNMTVDVSTFFNDYSRLILGSQGAVYSTTTSLGTYNIAPVLPINAGSASSYGFESTVKWNPISYLELTASYSLLQLKFDQPDPFGFTFANKAPKHQFNLSSSWDLPHNLELSNSIYTVGSIAPAGVTDISPYVRFDSKLTWKALDNLELSLVGQNLLQNQHREFSPFLYQNQTEVPRAVYGNVTWKF